MQSTLLSAMYGDFVRVAIITLLFSQIVLADVWQSVIRNTSNGGRIALAPSSDGGFLLLGQLEKPDPLHRDLYLTKFNPAGNMVWQKRYATSADETPAGIARIPNGGFVVAANTAPVSNSPFTVPAIIRINPSGAILWQKRFPQNQYAEFGWIGVTASNQITAVGSMGYSWQGAWVVQLDLNGKILWQKKIGGSESFTLIPQAARCTSDNGVMITGQTFDKRDQESDILVARLDSNGKVVWQKRYGTKSTFEVGIDLLLLRNGNSVVVAGTTGGVLVLELDQDGNILWQKRFQTDQPPTTIRETRPNLLVVGIGDRSSYLPNNARLLTIDASGNVLRQSRYVYANDIAAILGRQDGTVFLAGHSPNFTFGKDEFWIAKQNADEQPLTCEQDSEDPIWNESVLQAYTTKYAIQSTRVQSQSTNFEVSDMKFKTRRLCSD